MLQLHATHDCESHTWLHRAGRTTYPGEASFLPSCLSMSVSVSFFNTSTSSKASFASGIKACRAKHNREVFKKQEMMLGNTACLFDMQSHGHTGPNWTQDLATFYACWHTRIASAGPMQVPSNAQHIFCNIASVECWRWAWDSQLCNACLPIRHTR